MNEDSTELGSFSSSGGKIVLDGRSFLRSKVGDADANKGLPHWDGDKTFIDRNGVIRDKYSKMPTGEKIPDKNMPEFDGKVAEWDKDRIADNDWDRIKEPQTPEDPKQSKFSRWLSGRSNAELGVGTALIAVPAAIAITAALPEEAVAGTGVLLTRGAVAASRTISSASRVGLSAARALTRIPTQVPMRILVPVH